MSNQFVLVRAYKINVVDLDPSKDHGQSINHNVSV